MTRGRPKEFRTHIWRLDGLRLEEGNFRKIRLKLTGLAVMKYSEHGQMIIQYFNNETSRVQSGLEVLILRFGIMWAGLDQGL